MAIQDREKGVILVTGATGFLGRHLVEALQQAGFGVRVLVRNAAGRNLPFGPEVGVAEGDVLDILSLAVAMDGVDAVVHAAAMVSFWRKEAAQVQKVNVEGTANVVNACLEADVRLVQVSSIAALGSVPEGKFITEETPWQAGETRSVYASSKWEAEREVFRGMAEGLTAHFVNPSIIMGLTHDYGSGTGKMFEVVDRGLAVYNPGASGFVGVKDVARAIVAVLEADDLPNGEHFLLSAENLSFQTLFTMIAEGLGKRPPRFRLPKLPMPLKMT